MKTLVIIIPGAKTKYFPTLKKTLKWFYQYFGVSPIEYGRAWMAPFKKYLETYTPYQVKLFDWSGGISDTSVIFAARELCRLIDQPSEYEEIILFCKSLGGNVADLAIKKTGRADRIKTIMYVATPHRPTNSRLPSHIKQINVYSEADNYVDFANRALYLGFGKKHLPHTENIILKNVRHGEFMQNIEIEYQNKKITTFELYRQLLE